jgi:hypothetical protein
LINPTLNSKLQIFQIGSPADPWILLLTHLRHGLASGLLAGTVLVSAKGSPVGLRVLMVSWMLKAPVGAPGGSRAGCPFC